MRLFAGLLFLFAGVAAVIYGFAMVAPPIGEILNTFAAELVVAYQRYRNEHPIATGIGSILIGLASLGLAVVSLTGTKVKVAEPKRAPSFDGASEYGAGE